MPDKSAKGYKIRLNKRNLTILLTGTLTFMQSGVLAQDNTELRPEHLIEKSQKTKLSQNQIFAQWIMICKGVYRDYKEKGLMPPESGQCYEFINIGMLRAVNTSDTKSLIELLEVGANVNYVHRADGSTALMIAAYRGNIESAKMLLDRGAIPSLKNKHGKDSITIAKERGYSEVVKLISTKLR